MKLNRIKFGGLTLELNPINQNLEISSVGGEKKFFINSESGHSNLNVNIENRTINNLHIKNLESDTLTVGKIINPRLDHIETTTQIL